MRRVIALLLVCSTWTAGLADTRTIHIRDAWSRPAMGTAVVYATLRNSGGTPDELIDASSPLATHVSLHRSIETKMPGMSLPMNGMETMPSGGSVMSMQTLSNIPIPAHGTTKLAPGGYHLMLALRHDLEAGETIPLRLRFLHGGWISATATVRPMQ